MQHVDEGLLHARLDGQLAALGPGQEAEVERHLAECAECRARLEEARALRDRADALLRGDVLSVEIPPFETLAVRAGVAPRRRRRGPPLAWAASIVLAVGAGWLARSALQGRGPAEEPSARTVASAPAPEAVASAPSGSAPVAAEPAPITSVPAGAQRVASASPSPPAPAEAERTRAPEEERPARLRIAAREAARPEAQSPSGGAIGDVEPAPPPPTVAAPSAPPPPAGLAPKEADLGEAARRERDTAGRRAGFGEPRALALEGLVVASSGNTGGFRSSVIDPDGWFVIDGAEARRLLGRDPLRVRGLPVVTLQAGVVDGREVVRMRQALGQGALLSLVQSRALRPGAAPADSTLPEARDHTPGEQARLVRLVGEVTVVASAPLPADSLSRLLERLR